MELKQCLEYEHYFVDEAHREEMERIVGTCGYCAEYDRVILNDKQKRKFEEYQHGLSRPQ